MADFAGWIEDMELYDSHMTGGKYTWCRDLNHPSKAKLDRFLFSMEWEETFNYIRRQNCPG